MERTIENASAVSYAAKAAMFLGPSGSGKSASALDLMSKGATLVSDDITVVHRSGADLYVSPPGEITGMIEARGIGVLGAEYAASARLVLVVDLAREETERLPPFREHQLLGLGVHLVYGPGSPLLCNSVLQFLKGGRLS